MTRAGEQQDSRPRGFVAPARAQRHGGKACAEKRSPLRCRIIQEETIGHKKEKPEKKRQGIVRGAGTPEKCLPEVGSERPEQGEEQQGVPPSRSLTPRAPPQEYLQEKNTADKNQRQQHGSQAAGTENKRPQEEMSHTSAIPREILRLFRSQQVEQRGTRFGRVGKIVSTPRRQPCKCRHDNQNGDIHENQLGRSLSLADMTSPTITEVY